MFKKLLTSGGDFSTTTELWEFVRDRLTEGLSEHIVIESECDAVFGVNDDVLNVSTSDQFNFNNYNIYIRSANGGGPSTILGSVNLYNTLGLPILGSGYLYMSRLKLGVDLSNDSSRTSLFSWEPDSLSGWSQSHTIIQSSVIALIGRKDGVYNVVNAGYGMNPYGNAGIYNSHVYFYGYDVSSELFYAPILSNSLTGKLYNNLIASYSSALEYDTIIQSGSESDDIIQSGSKTDNIIQVGV
jgi:hypothetical protein